MPLGPGKQAAEFLTLRLTGDVAGFGVNTDIVDWEIAASEGNVDMNNGVISLVAGKSYAVLLALSLASFAPSATAGFGIFEIVESLTDVPIITGVAAGYWPTTFSNSTRAYSGVSQFYFTPATDTDIKARCTIASGTFTLQSNNSLLTVRAI